MTTIYYKSPDDGFVVPPLVVSWSSFRGMEAPIDPHVESVINVANLIADSLQLLSSFSGPSSGFIDILFDYRF